MPRNLVLADSDIGYGIISWLIDGYPTDLALVVVTEENAVFDLCRRCGIPTVVFTDEAAIVATLRERGENLDFGFTLWWPKLVKSSLLELPRGGFVNTHPSLLPHARGKHYNFWTIVEEAPFGVSLHLLDKGVDTGPVIAQEPIPYDWEDTGASLYQKAKEAMPLLFRDCYPRLRTGNLNARPQDKDAGSFHRAKELDPASWIELDRHYAARELFNLLRARTFPGHPSCRFVDGGRTYEVRVNIEEVKP